MSTSDDLAFAHFFRRTAYQVATVLSLLLAGSLYGCPQYNIWSNEMGGRAELARANGNRQIKIQEAHAHLESAKLLADAEVIRAEGVKKANTIVAEGLGGPEGYLRYLYIHALQETAGKNSQVIYIPTEAGLPILEAGKRSNALQLR